MFVYHIDKYYKNCKQVFVFSVQYIVRKNNSFSGKNIMIIKKIPQNTLIINPTSHGNKSKK